MSIALDIDLSPVSDYRPTGTLEIDTRPVDGDTVRRWREQMRPFRTGPASREHPVQRECADAFGVSARIWSGWETDGIEWPCWAALVREWVRADRALEVRCERAPTPVLKAVAQVVGGYGPLAEELECRAITIRTGWARTGAPFRRGYGPLLWWLFDDMGLRRTREVAHRSQAKLTPQQVREIRRRHARDESALRIAEDYPVTRSTIYRVIRRDAYQWVT